MVDIKTVADEAEIISNGYAFKKCEMYYRVLNLNRPSSAIVFSENGEVVETTMDDIEIEIVKEYFNKNKKYMEE